MILANSVSNPALLREQAARLLDLWAANPSREFMIRMLRQSQGADFILACLYQEKSLSPGDLARKLNVSTARIARLLQSMEEKEYIIRQKDPDDGRSLLILLSSQGEKKFLENRECLIELLEELIQAIGYEELEEFVRLSQKVSQAFVQVTVKRGK